MKDMPLCTSLTIASTCGTCRTCYMDNISVWAYMHVLSTQYICDCMCTKMYLHDEYPHAKVYAHMNVQGHALECLILHMALPTNSLPL